MFFVVYIYFSTFQYVSLITQIRSQTVEVSRGNSTYRSSIILTADLRDRTKVLNSNIVATLVHTLADTCLSQVALRAVSSLGTHFQMPPQPPPSLLPTLIY